MKSLPLTTAPGESFLRPNFEYVTWDGFKRDLETKLGRYLNVDSWLRVKPKKPLPWNDSDMLDSLEDFLKMRRSDGDE